MIVTPFTELAGIRHPLVLAPMAGVAGGRLAAAVSGAGGLGLLGGGYADPRWLAREYAAAGVARVGVGFITWRLAQVPEAFDFALSRRPAAVWLSFDAIDPFVARIKAVGALCLAQVQSVAQARAARAAGADVIIAQGGEAGGHGGMRGTLALVPAVIDAVDPIPVLAAGGIADGRGCAAALMLGAAGVVLGTAFYSAVESLASAPAKAAAVVASGDATVRGAVFDRLRGWDWPPGYALRTLANETTARWPDAADGLDAALEGERAEFERALADGDVNRAPVMVGEVVDLVGGQSAAETIVQAVMAATERRLANAGGLLAPG